MWKSTFGIGSEACYHAALELPAGERARFLANAEPDVRREVESLLLHEGDADEVLEQPVWKAVDHTVTLALAQGTLMGDYRIGGKLGAGGMGEV